MTALVEIIRRKLSGFVSWWIRCGGHRQRLLCSSMSSHGSTLCSRCSPSRSGYHDDLVKATAYGVWMAYVHFDKHAFPADYLSLIHLLCRSGLFRDRCAKVAGRRLVCTGECGNVWQTKEKGGDRTKWGLLMEDGRKQRRRFNNDVPGASAAMSCGMQQFSRRRSPL
jgi:hypothetical protein